MQRLLGLQLQVECNKDELLETLRKNRARHKEIVIEARKGYMAKAKETLQEKLEELETGKVKSVSVSLSAPQDMSSVYDTTIKMLELHQQPTITLSSDEVRMLVEDKWDWTARFLASNAMYSDIAANMAREDEDE
jgi:hypothetical protein